MQATAETHEHVTTASKPLDCRQRRSRARRRSGADVALLVAVASASPFLWPPPGVPRAFRAARGLRHGPGAVAAGWPRPVAARGVARGLFRKVRGPVASAARALAVRAACAAAAPRAGGDQRRRERWRCAADTRRCCGYARRNPGAASAFAGGFGLRQRRHGGAHSVHAAPAVAAGRTARGVAPRLGTVAAVVVHERQDNTPPVVRFRVRFEDGVEELWPWRELHSWVERYDSDCPQQQTQQHSQPAAATHALAPAPAPVPPAAEAAEGAASDEAPRKQYRGV